MLSKLNDTYTRSLADALDMEEVLFVHGEGNANAPLVALVGEAPGEQETLLRRPFVGKAGKNLDVFLQALNIPRESIYITNVVKVRPFKVGPTGRKSNRTPNRKEIAAFLPWLREELALVNPRVVVTLGNTALQALLSGDVVIGSCHGRPMEREGAAPVFPLYHPAAVIYDRALKTTYDNDLALLAQYLARDLGS